MLAQHAQVTIEDASGRGLSASGRWAQLFKYISLSASDGGVVRRSATTKVIDTSGGKDAATAAWLAKFFGVTVTTPSPAPSSSAQSSAATIPANTTTPGVIVILGQDEENAFLNTPGVGN